MITVQQLQAILQRLDKGAATDAERKILHDEFEAGRLTAIAAGDRSVAGNVIGSVITTGDNNVIHVFENIELETFHQILRQAVQSLRVPALLTPEEFTERAVNKASSLAGHSEVLIGRDDLRCQMHQFLASDAIVAIVHGAGGLGKTRFLLTLPELIPSGTSLWYVRNGAESIEVDIAELDRGQQHIIIVDDAHRSAQLPQLGEVFENPELLGKVKLVLATRSVFQDSVTYQLGSPTGNQICHLKFKPIDNAGIDQILQASPFQIQDRNHRRALISIADGNPLIAGVAARLVQRNGSLLELNREQVLSHYLNEIIQDLTTAQAIGSDAKSYIRYLEILAALGTIDLEDAKLREQIQTTIGISTSDEDQIVQQLVKAGLIERYWMTLRFASEVLADHILTHHFFNQENRRADYRSQIIDPFFALRPKQILATLAEAEVKGKEQAGFLLTQQLDELTQAADQAGNVLRLIILDVLSDIAELRSDDALLVIANIVDGAVLPPENYEDHWFGQREVTHTHVLGTAIDLLKSTYWSTLEDSLEYFCKLATYRSSEQEYENVRQKAGKVLAELAEIEWHKPYATQIILLDKLEAWFQRGLSEKLDLILVIAKSMLKMEVYGIENDLAQPRHFIRRQAELEPTDSLRQIRERSLNLLFTTYRHTVPAKGRIEIIKSLERAIVLHHSKREHEDQKQSWEWIKLDCMNIARFLLEEVVPQSEVPVLSAVSSWLWHSMHWGGYQAPELEALRQSVEKQRLYQTYRYLSNALVYGDLEDESIVAYEVLEQRRCDAIAQYINSLSLGSFEQTVQDLEMILRQLNDAEESNNSWCNRLFYVLGRQQPEFAKQLIDKAIAENLLLKNFLGRVADGLRAAESQTVWQYVQDWANSDDIALWCAAADSYSSFGMPWNDLAQEHWDLLQSLVAKNTAPVDRKITSLIWQFHSYRPEFTILLLKTLATRDDSTLEQVGQLLANRTEQGWMINFDKSEDYIEICQNFERLPDLGYHLEICLHRLGQIAPMLVIDFIERRVSIKRSQQRKDHSFEEVPFEFHRAMESIRESQDFPDLLRRVRDWMLREDFWWRFMTPRILKRIAGGWSEALYDVLLEWVETEDYQKLRAAAFCVRELSAGSKFYELSREILCRTRDEKILGSITSAIYSTPGVIVGDFSNFQQRRLEEVAPWLTDPNIRVRGFAKRLTNNLKQSRQRNLEHEELHRRNW